MDSALELKIKASNHSNFSFKEAESYLNSSELFKNLLTDFNPTSINLLNRLIQLSEIPFSQEFTQVKEWRDKLADLTFCEEGFSLSGKKDDLLACYNSMITTVLIRLGYSNTARIDKGIAWILKYQNTKRNETNTWKGKGIQKYGGCMKSTPCYIGVVKSMIALSQYRAQYKSKTSELNSKLKNGLEYILDHKVYKRKSKDEPITKDVVKLTYPNNYKTNIIEILRLLKDNQLLGDPRTEEARKFLEKKRTKDGYWKANAVYKSGIWVEFDKPKEKAEWLTNEIRMLKEN